jgi:putative methyltransferase (TIGR04325 family)
MMSVLGALRYHLHRLLRPTPSIPAYESFARASQDSETYEEPAILEVVVKKTELVRDRLRSGGRREVSTRRSVQNAFVLTYARGLAPLNVLDFGGACGASFFELDHLLPGLIAKWRVVETEAMARAARQVFQEERICLYSDLDEAVQDMPTRDLLMASGVLQYLPDPVSGLSHMLDLGFSYLYVTRTPVTAEFKRPLIGKQVAWLSAHGPGPMPPGIPDRKVSCPITLVPEDQLLQSLSDSHAPALCFAEGEEKTMKFGGQPVVVKDIGFLLQRV